MINIEGDYHEILKWMNDHRSVGYLYAGSRGVSATIAELDNTEQTDWGILSFESEGIRDEWGVLSFESIRDAWEWCYYEPWEDVRF